MSCPNCGKPTDKESRFCGFCGSPLTPPQAAEAAEPVVSDAAPADTAQEAPTEAIASAPVTASTPATPTAPAASAPVPDAPSASAAPVAPQNQPTQQFQTAPAAPQEQPTQQFPTAAPAAPAPQQTATNPTVAALTKPESIATMGAGLGIGLAAALVLALLGSIAFFFAGDNLEGTFSDIPGMSSVSNMLTDSGGDYNTPNILQIVITVLVMGISGSLNMTTGASGFSDYSDNGTHLCLPVGLPGIALMLGAAFGIINSTLFQATARGMNSLIVSVCRQLVVILPAAWILGQQFGLNAVWYSFPIAEIAAFFISYILLWREYRTELRFLGTEKEKKA